MVSAKDKMLAYLLDHVGELITNAKLREISGNVSDWARSLRTLRQEGWAIVATTKPERGYTLKSKVKSEGNERGNINAKLRFLVLERDKGICQRCGRTAKDGVKMHIDHIRPVEWGGKTEIGNLQTLCADCNQGKKDFVASQDPELMTKIYSVKSGYQKLKIFLESTPNEDISFDILESIAGIRDWERTIRLIRKKERMKIRALRKKDGVWYYRYEPKR